MNFPGKSLLFSAALVAIMAAGPAWGKDDETAELTNRLNEATATLRDTASPEKGIRPRVLRKPSAVPWFLL
jgi:hypothetical protein